MTGRFAAPRPSVAAPRNLRGRGSARQPRSAAPCRASPGCRQGRREASASPLRHLGSFLQERLTATNRDQRVVLVEAFVLELDNAGVGARLRFAFTGDLSGDMHSVALEQRMRK